MHSLLLKCNFHICIMKMKIVWNIEQFTCFIKYLIHLFHSSSFFLAFFFCFNKIKFKCNFLITGCAFLTYFSPESALNAQNALHEKHTLPGVSPSSSLSIMTSIYVHSYVILLYLYIYIVYLLLYTLYI